VRSVSGFPGGLWIDDPITQPSASRVDLPNFLMLHEYNAPTSEAQFRAMFEVASVGMAQADPQTGQWLRVNQKMCMITGYTTAELLKARIPDITHPEDRNKDWDEFQRVVKGEAPDYHLEKRYIRKDGSVVWVNVNVTIIRDAAGQPVRSMATIEDITERKRADERIAQLNRLRAILGGVDHAIVHIADQQNLLDEICRVAVEIGGFKLAWIGMVSPDGSVPPVAKAGAIGYLDGIRVVTHEVEPEGCGPVGKAIRENRPVEIVDFESDPRTIPWRDQAMQFGLHYAAVFPLRIAGKAVGSFQVYATRAVFFDEDELTLLTQVSEDISFALTAIDDATRRKQAEQDVIEISGHELNRIGQELHDDVCQWLAGTAFMAGVFAKRIARESPGNAAKAQEIADYTRHTLEALRMLARGLTPAVIQSEGGLAGALFKLATNVEELFHIRCRCDCAGTVELRDQTVALHLYRIAQEAITNAVRHGGAHEVHIILRSDEGRVSMVIRDDGSGIPQPLPQTHGMGLRSMRYRAEIIGATLDIRPGSHGGTEIDCTLPKDL
jgi:PAS domain S-box-containing protein